MREDLYPSRTNEEKIFPRVDPTVYSKESVGEHSLDENELKYYEKNGFIMFPNMFSKSEVEELRNELKELEKNQDLREKEEC